MAIALYSKHTDAIAVHDSMVEFVFDYQDSIDNRGLEVWFIPDAEAAELTAEEGSAYERWSDISVPVHPTTEEPR